MPNKEYWNFTPPQSQNSQDMSEDLYEDSNTYDVKPHLMEEHLEDEVRNEFYYNLATDFECGELDYIGIGLRPKVDEDKTSREYKDERYAKMLKRLGFSENSSIGGADFPGASDVVHPLMAEGVVDFSSRAIKELLPPNGPVKTKILGKQTTEKVERAERKRQFMNWVFTSKLNYRVTLEKMLTQLALAGSAFIKLYWDNAYNELCVDFVPIDHLYIPYNCEDFTKAERITQIIRLDKDQFKRKVKEGIYYADASSELFESSTENNLELPDYVSDNIEGKNSVTNTEQDETITLFEVHCNLELDFDDITHGEMAPYIVTISQANNSVLAIYRNWEIDDDCYRKLDWFVQFNYITWRGLYGIGFAEILDGVAGAVTGSLRAILDSALAANFPTLLATKGAKIIGQNTNVSPGQITQVEGPNGMNSRLQDQIMPLQLGQPQPILMQLMEYLDGKVKEFCNTTSSALENVGDETPVGTTLALIEEGSKRYAAINARLHESDKRVFKIANRIFKHNLDEQCIIDELGELTISRYDFEYDDIEVVSDPHIFSESQRYALNQAVLQLASSAPQMYNMLEVHRRTLESMHVPDIDKLFSTPQQVGKLNAVAENIASLKGTPLQAFTEQNHMAHLKTHFSFAMNPIFGSNPANLPKMGSFLQHIQDHISMLYGQVFNEALVHAGGGDYNIIDGESMPDVDEELAQLNDTVLAYVQKQLQPFIQKAQQYAQAVQKASQPPQDPNMLKAQAEQQKVQIEQQRLQFDSKLDAQKMQLDAQVNQQKLQTAQMDNETKKMQTLEDNNYNRAMLEVENMKANTQEGMALLDAHLKIEELRAAQGEKVRTEHMDQVMRQQEMEFERDNKMVEHAVDIYKNERTLDQKQKATTQE